MKRITLFATLGAILLIAATTALVFAWPDQPPDKVLISGPGIEGQIEVKDNEALEIFRLGTLEDLTADSPLPPRSPAPVEFGAGFKIVRFFDGGFDFARLTYYPNPRGERGYLYWEDGPDLSGDHTEYNRTWLYTHPDIEMKLRVLLEQLGAKLDKPASADVMSSNANTNANPPKDSGAASAATQSTQATTGQTNAASATTTFSPILVALAVAVIGVLVAGGLFVFRQRQRINRTR